MVRDLKNIFKIKQGNIADPSNWSNQKIDTIVNAAKPTLMGSNQGVDYAIHSSIDNVLAEGDTFNKHICSELETSEDKNQIRCNRGQAVTTSGYGFCNWVIHAVGIPYDGLADNKCTSSCIDTLESCYHAIIGEVKKHLNIKEIGIPIIGAGEYKFPFELAFEIAITSTWNALLEWKQQDEEMFEMSKLQQITFFIYDADTSKRNSLFTKADEIKKRYQKYFEKERKIAFQSSVQIHKRCLNELKKYDEKRGYFSIAKWFRRWLMRIRWLFMPLMNIKDIFGKKDWATRRQIVEILTICKVAVPLLGILLLAPTREVAPIHAFKITLDLSPILSWSLFFIVVYCMADTVTYLLTLILLADVQKPSANIIRSMIMLFINYIEISLDLTFLMCFFTEHSLTDALSFGFLGEIVTGCTIKSTEYWLLYLNEGLKFFFLTMVLGYFFSHVRQRKFES